MIEVAITEEHLACASVLSEEMGMLNNSITKGEGNLSGFLGEVVVAELTN